MALHMSKRRIVRFAREYGFDRAKRVGTYNGYDVYSPYMSSGANPIIGFPHFILVKDNEIEMYVDNDLKVMDALCPTDDNLDED